MVQMTVGIIWRIECAKREWLSPTQFITDENGGSNFLTACHAKHGTFAGFKSS